MAKKPGELFDLDNLEKAKSLIEQISNIINTSFKGSTSGSANIQSQIAENDLLKQYYTELIRLSNNNIKAVQDVSKLSSSFRDQINQIKDVVEEASIQAQASKEVALEAAKEDIRLKNILKKNTENYNAYLSDIDKAIELKKREIEASAEEEWQRLGVIGRATTNKDRFMESRVIKPMEDYIYSITDDYREAYDLAQQTGSKFGKVDVNKVITKNNKEVTTNLNNSAKDLSKSGQVLNLAGNTLKKGADILLNLFTQGIYNQTGTYNSTFENIAVRSGMTRSTYTANQRSTSSSLKAMGLGDNIATTEVQEMWNSLASIGMSEADILATSIDNTITRKIVPYLDTTSKSFNIINHRLNGEFVKDIRGINKYNQEIAGNNYLTQDLLNTIIDEVQPMSDKALEDLAQGSAELTAMMNYLMTPTENGGRGLSESAAKSYVTQLFKAQKYSDQMLSSGSLTDKMFIVGNIAKGINVYNPNDWNNAVGVGINNDQFFANIVPGYNSTYTGLITNTVANVAGMGYERMSGALNLSSIGLTGNMIASMTDNTYSNMYSNKAAKELASGEYQTEKQKQEIFMTNMTTGIATIIERLGVFEKLPEIFLVGLGGLFTKWIGEGIIKGAIGKGGEAAAGALSTGGKGSILASGGGLALGTIAGVAAVAAISTAITDGIHNSKVAEASKYGYVYEQEYANYEGDAAAAASGQYQAEKFGRKGASNDSVLGNAIAGTFAGMGASIAHSLNPFKWSFLRSDPSEYNKVKWDNFLNENARSFSPEQIEWLQYAYAMAIRDAGLRDGDITAIMGSNITAGGIKAFLHKSESEGKDLSSQLIWATKILKNYDLYPKGPADNYSDYAWTAEDMKDWGMYRSGLSDVPYDNYPALLHEGEAVLTASTANELRGLIDEYRSSQDTSINIDTAIQEQTITLVERLDTIIQSMNIGNAGTQLNSTTEKVINSMRTMKSTSSFQNG